MTAWIEKRLGDCVTFISGGTPSRSNPEFWDGEIPWASNKDMKVGRLYDTIEHISIDAAESCSKLVPANTLLLVVRGMALAKLLPIAITQRPMAFNQDLKALEPKEGISGAFLYYWFVANADFVLSKADEAAHGTKRLQTPALEDLIVRLPKDYREQEQIVSHLAIIDDLIENCDQRVQLFEEAARLIYTEWFVQTRFPFSSRSQRTFRESGLFDIADILTGFAFKGEFFNEVGKGEPIIRIRDIPNQLTQTWSTEDCPSEYFVEEGDLLIGMDGFFHIGNWAGQRGYLVQRVCRVRARNPALHAYLRLALEKPIKHLEATLTGSTVAHLGLRHLKEVTIALPPENDLHHLAVFDEMLKQRLALQKKIRLLREARDLILPRLISGQLRL